MSRRLLASVVVAVLVAGPNPLVAFTIPKPAPIPTSLLPANPLEPVECGVAGPSLANAKAGMWVNAADGEKRARRLEFDAAKAKVNELRKRNPKFEQWAKEAEARAIAKGWKKNPAFDGGSEVVVIEVEKKVARLVTAEPPKSLLARLMDAPRAWASLFLPVAVEAAQDAPVYLPEGVLWWTSWDDGDPITWEGSLGVVEYISGYNNYGEGVGQFYTPGNGLGDGPDNADSTVLYSEGSVLYAPPNSTTPPWRRGLATLVGCSVSGCFFNAGICLLAGPGALACTGIRCGLMFAACTFGAYASMVAMGEVPYCQPHNNRPCTNTK